MQEYALFLSIRNIRLCANKRKRKQILLHSKIHKKLIPKSIMGISVIKNSTNNSTEQSDETKREQLFFTRRFKIQPPVNIGARMLSQTKEIKKIKWRKRERGIVFPFFFCKRIPELFYVVVFFNYVLQNEWQSQQSRLCTFAFVSVAKNETKRERNRVSIVSLCGEASFVPLNRFRFVFLVSKVDGKKKRKTNNSAD